MVSVLTLGLFSHILSLASDAIVYLSMRSRFSAAGE